MDSLPLDCIGHLSKFLNMKDTVSFVLVNKNITLSRFVSRQKRFDFCKVQYYPRRIRNGKCVNSKCRRRKLTCIILEPLQSKNLANYCGICFSDFYPHINVHEFVMNR